MVLRVKYDWKIPWAKCYGNTNGLLDGKETTARC
jgi:hypothetical protein